MKIAIGADPGLATFGLSCVSEEGGTYALERCEVFRSANQEDFPFATNIAARTRDLALWLARQLNEVERLDFSGAKLSFAAERFEFLRNSVSASELAAGHAALVSTFGQRGHYQYETTIQGLPDYPSAKEVKRAVTGCSVASKRVVECAVRQVVRGAAERLDGMLKGDREHAADSIAVALHSLGCRVAPLLVSSDLNEVPQNLRGHSLVTGCVAADLYGRALIVFGDDARRDARLPILLEREFLSWNFHSDRAWAFVPSTVIRDDWWAVKKNADKARRFLATALKE